MAQQRLEDYGSDRRKKEEEKKNSDAIQYTRETYYHGGAGPTTEELNKVAEKNSGLTQRKNDAEKNLTYTAKYQNSKYNLAVSAQQSLMEYWENSGLEEKYKRLKAMEEEYERNPSPELAREHNALLEDVRKRESELRVYENAYQGFKNDHDALRQQGENEWKTYQEINEEWDKNQRILHYMGDDYLENDWEHLSEDAWGFLKSHDNRQNETLQSTNDWIDQQISDLDEKIQNTQIGYENKLLYYRNYYSNFNEYPEGNLAADADLESYKTKIKGLEEQKAQYQQMKKDNQNELDFRIKYSGLKYNDDFQEYAGYVPEELGTFALLTDTGGTYRHINGDAVPGIWDSSKGHLKEMTPDEISIFNYLYRKGEEEEAKNYIEALTPVLYRRQRESREKSIEEFSQENWGTAVLSSIGSVLTKPLEGISYIGQGIDYLMDGEIDQNAPYNAFVYENNAARNAVEEKVRKNWGEAGSFLYQLGMGLADFAYTLVLSKGVASGLGTLGMPIADMTKAASRLSLAIMGTESAAQTVLESKDKGLDDGDAFWLGTIAGATEILTEKVSLDTLLDKVGMGKNKLTYLLKNALAEGGEEMTSEAVNWLADVLISQDKSDWQETLFYYKVMGFSEDEAFLEAMKEQGRKMLKSGAAGALTGGMLAGANLAGSQISEGVQGYRNYRQAVQNGRQYHALNNLTGGNLARSLGNMNIEQAYRNRLMSELLAESRKTQSTAGNLSPEQAYNALRTYGLDDGTAQRLAERWRYGADTTSVPKENGKAEYSFRGYDSKTGKGMYEGNFPVGTPKKAKSQQILSLIQNIWSKEPVTLSITQDGKTRQIQARYDPTYSSVPRDFTDASKIAGGNRHGTAKDQRVTLDLGPDYPKITADAKYNYSKAEIGKESNTHKNVKEWHYFVNDILFAENGSSKYVPYRVSINIKETGNGNFVYSYSAENQERMSAPQTLHAVDNREEISTINTQPFNTSIPNKGGKVNGSELTLGESIRRYGVDSQKASEVIRLVKDTGVNAVFDGTLPDSVEGYYKDGMLHLNPNADNIRSVFSHELTHALEGTEAYHRLWNTVLSQYGNDTALQNALNEKMSVYKAGGIELTRSDAAYELVAEFVKKNLFTNVSAIQSLASYDLDLAGKIKNTISGLAAKVTGNSEKSFLRTAEHLYTQAIQEMQSGAKGALRSSANSVDAKQLYASLRAAGLDDGAAWGLAKRYAPESGLSAEGKKEQYSIQTLPDGRKYVKADRQVIFGNDPKRWAGQITNYINGQIRKGENVSLLTDDGDLLEITRDTAGKAQFRNIIRQPNGSYGPMTNAQYATKLRAEGHIDELAQISSRGKQTVADTGGKHKGKASNGWNYRTAYFKDADGKYYSLNISVSQGKNGNVIYNIANIRERTPPKGV